MMEALLGCQEELYTMLDDLVGCEGKIGSSLI